MEYQKLNNGTEMPMLGFGTFMLRGEECERSTEQAISCGYRMIDTAEAYGNEAEVGRAIKASGVPRDELFVVTKVNFGSYGDAEAAVERSLRNLGTDYIDLMLLHWPFADYYSAWRALEKMHSQGKLRAVGVSNFEPSQLVDLIAYNKTVPAVDQIETNLYCQRRAERKWLDKYGVAHMAYAPLGQGRRKEMFDEPAVKEAAERHGKTSAQVLLRFLIQCGISVIPRSSRSERIAENFELFDFTLADDEMAALVQADKKCAMIGNPQNPELVEAALKW